MQNQPVSSRYRGIHPALFALLMAAWSGLTAAQSLPARTQTAPAPAPVLTPHRSVPTAVSGSATRTRPALPRISKDYYFQQGTAPNTYRPSGIRPWRNSVTTRSIRQRPAVSRAPLAAHAGPARVIATASPSRIALTIRTHRINRRSPWSERESSGLYFGPRPVLPGTLANAPSIRPMPRWHAARNLHRHPTPGAERRLGHDRHEIIVLPVERSGGASASRGAGSPDELPLFYSPETDVYADPVDGQNREQFRQDSRRCMNQAEQETGLSWKILAPEDGRDDVDGPMGDLLGANRECLEVAGYDIY